MNNSSEELAAEAEGAPGQPSSHALKRELGLWDLVPMQILLVVGITWPGLAARQGGTHLWFWLAAILFLFGTGPIKGFAVTLTIGLLANLFTAVFVSRTIFDYLLSKRERTAPISI